MNEIEMTLLENKVRQMSEKINSLEKELEREKGNKPEEDRIGLEIVKLYAELHGISEALNVFGYRIKSEDNGERTIVKFSKRGTAQ